MVKLNDETWKRMMHEAFESRVSFGVPEDIVRPYVTGMLREFVGAFPSARINMVSSISRLLLKQFEDNGIEVMLTTEPAATGAGAGAGVCLYHAPLFRGSSQPDAVSTRDPQWHAGGIYRTAREWPTYAQRGCP